MPQFGYLEPVPYRVRGVRAKEVVVDSERARLLRREGESVPVFCFPPEDVRAERLGRDAVAEHDGFVLVSWEAVTEWFAEEAQLFGHARDPYHRIDVFPSARHVRVLREGVLLAETRRSRALFETGLPARWYMPIEDVRAELIASPTKTRCAYKGSASYFSVRAGDRLLDDLVWTYREPQLEAEAVRDLVCFFNERVDLELDSVRGERPRTQWSRDDDS
jgi:uncharacterized protein (DUF427 family)